MLSPKLHNTDKNDNDNDDDNDNDNKFKFKIENKVIVNFFVR